MTALTLTAFFGGGDTEEALAYADYIRRAATGHPSEVQIMYGVGGERRLTEFEVDELPGYEARAPCGSATLLRISSSWTCTAS